MQRIDSNQSCMIIAELGINHNGSLETAIQMMDEAKDSGCDLVKFQKRVPEICVPKSEWDKPRNTPWGTMSYIDYKNRIEFGQAEFDTIDAHSKKINLPWFASVWDLPSVDFIAQYKVPIIKAASASITDHALLLKIRSIGIPVMISTGMSSWNDIHNAIITLGTQDLLVAHSTSIYPCPIEKLNLSMIDVLKEKYPNTPIGYSGHEAGIQYSYAAVAKGAEFIERHFTLDKTMWGTDQSASLDPIEMKQLVSMIRSFEIANGSGIKEIYPEELPVLKKLRNHKNVNVKYS